MGSKLQDNASLLAEIAALRAENAAQSTIITELRAQMTEHQRLFEQHSGNSHKPPSSDTPAQKNKRRRKKKPSGRKQGGQVGHPGHHRALLPESEVDSIIDVYARRCEMCLREVPKIPTKNFVAHQVVDIQSDGRRFVSEYRRHVFVCDCGEMTLADDADVPKSAFGPRLKSVVCQLSGTYSLSRRSVPALLRDIFGVSMSLGSVSTIESEMSVALEPCCDEAMQEVESSTVVHSDETGFLECNASRSMWVFACVHLSVFRIVADGSREKFRSIFTRRKKSILVSDRASVFLYWPMKYRQICWSHVQRLFVSFHERDGPAHGVGAELLECMSVVFLYWKDFKSGRIDRIRLQILLAEVRALMHGCILRAIALKCSGLSGSCRNLEKHFSALWTFASTPGVEPTNNHAERELRGVVMWRKKSFGAQSLRGCNYVARMMTVVRSLRKQGRSVLNFLERSLKAEYPSQRPSLLPV